MQARTHSPPDLVGVGRSTGVEMEKEGNPLLAKPSGECHPLGYHRPRAEKPSVVSASPSPQSLQELIQVELRPLTVPSCEKLPPGVRLAPK